MSLAALGAKLRPNHSLALGAVRLAVSGVLFEIQTGARHLKGNVSLDFTSGSLELIGMTQDGCR